MGGNWLGFSNQRMAWTNHDGVRRGGDAPMKYSWVNWGFGCVRIKNSRLNLESTENLHSHPKYCKTHCLKWWSSGVSRCDGDLLIYPVAGYYEDPEDLLAVVLTWPRQHVISLCRSSEIKPSNPIIPHRIPKLAILLATSISSLPVPSLLMPEILTSRRIGWWEFVKTPELSSNLRVKKPMGFLLQLVPSKANGNW